MADNPIFSYTRRDYESSRQEGLAQIPTLSKGSWTDLNATDPGIIILDYVHALVDMINYYQDHQALESFIVTAKERSNIFRLAKQLSYKVRSAKGATTEVTFTSPLVYNHSIKIPQYTTLSTNSGITFLTTKTAYLEPGSNQVTVPCVQGTLNILDYQGTGVSRFSDLEDANNQSIRITNDNIDIDSIHIVDNSGNTWTPLDYIVFSTSTDRVYQADLEADDSVVIRFGDGERGFIPRETDTLTITYINNLAEEGRVGANTIVNIVDHIHDIYGNFIEFFVTNRESSSGGASSQSSRDITELAPGVIKAQNRAVTLTDFESLAKMVAGVADAKAYDINVAPDLCLFHEVKVVIVPESGTSSNATLRESVYNYLYQRMIPPTNLQVLSPSEVPIDIEIVVKQMEYKNATEGAVDYTIREVVEEYFNERMSAVGQDFYPSDLGARITAIGDVQYLISITPSTPVEISKLSLAVLGNLTVTVQ